MAARQSAPPTDAPNVAVERLAGLGRLWGALKYFHPFLAYRNIDWDAALIETIPLVRRAATRDDYRAAIDHLLSFLGDPWTKTLPWGDEPAAQPPPHEDAPAAPVSVARTDDVAVVTATDYRSLTGEDGGRALKAAFEDARTARAILLDLRHLAGGAAAWWPATQSLEQALPALLERPRRAASLRRRMYSGHPPHRGTTSGGYYTAFVYHQGAPIDATAPVGSERPLAFVVNPDGARVWRQLAGLQSAAGAVVVSEGDVEPEPDGASPGIELAGGLRVRIRPSELVHPDGRIGFRPDAVVPPSRERDWDKSPGVAAALAWLREGRSTPNRPPASPVPESPPERGYPEMHAPTPEYRLLALFRFWTAIDVFFPYKDLIGRDWADVLREFIPRFDREGDEVDYAVAVAHLAAQTHDTHAFANSKVLGDHIGSFAPPVRVRTVEGEPAIEHVFESTPDGPRVGDVVVAVDGLASAERDAAVATLFAASTPQALRRKLDEALLAGPKDSVARLTVRGADDGERDVELIRTMSRWRRPDRPYPVFCVLPQGVGYVDLARLTVAQVGAAFQMIEATPAVIFDLRGYPKGTAWPIAPRLAEKEVVTARFECPQRYGLDWWFGARASLTFEQRAAPSHLGRYAGRVVVLINEDAISQAEHTCLYLEASANATFVGTPTNGANGDVTNVILPGDVRVGFSGQAVRHADGRQLQRVGIQPHVRVEPTLAGLRAGRDEVLDAAIELLCASRGPGARPGAQAP